MKTLEKGMYLLPDEQFEFELKKTPTYKTRNPRRKQKFDDYSNT